MESRRLEQFVACSEVQILFLSQESSADVVLEALGIGSAFVLKTDARKELIPP